MTEKLPQPTSVDILLDEAHRIHDALAESNVHLDNKASFILALAGVALGAVLQLDPKSPVVACIQLFTVLGATGAGVAALGALTLRSFQTAPNLKGLEKYLDRDPLETKKAVFANLRWAVEENEKNVLPGKRVALRNSFYFSIFTLIMFAVLGILKSGNSTGGTTMTTEFSNEPKATPAAAAVEASAGAASKMNAQLPVDKDLKMTLTNSNPKLLDSKSK